ncbi:MAG: extensin [Brevundimonas sp.]|uniref:Extensin family protein n=1 Tax=Brevundimonas albigilva TaxID=1312364 RepID=A0ABY4SMC6_9CAUL|nr:MULTISPECIES: extensin family protein [Brevundimonas]PZU58479.1 MAG: extensin [Brevundimonas sp.]UQV18002.1 extensin family protein [Brevundimonas albigilva]URI14013.1 extensin family protein [Brevundimonas albigilva]
MRRDFADFWNLLWEAALLVCAAFALLNAYAPPQDLPWKPLDLDRPIGRATATKVAAFDLPRAATPEQVAAPTEACMRLLREAGVQVERAPDRDDGGFCQVRGAVRIVGGATPLAPAGVVMQCPLALRYVLWDRQVLQPAARDVLGSPVARVENFGTYSCRRIYGSTDTGDRPSEHARANALDVAAVTLADGRRVSVKADWAGQGPAGAEGGRFLKRVGQGGCRLFSNVLTPEYNAAHADHLHLDAAPRGVCG